MVNGKRECIVACEQSWNFLAFSTMKLWLLQSPSTRSWQLLRRCDSVAGTKLPKHHSLLQVDWTLHLRKINPDIIKETSIRRIPLSNKHSS